MPKFSDTNYPTPTAIQQTLLPGTFLRNRLSVREAFVCTTQTLEYNTAVTTTQVKFQSEGHTSGDFRTTATWANSDGPLVRR
jgi:hypothetical protein